MKKKKRHLKLVSSVRENSNFYRPFEIGEEDSFHIPPSRRFQSKGGADNMSSNPGISGEVREDNFFLKDHTDEKDKNFSGIGPKGYQKSDQRIHEEVCDELMKNKEIDASEMMVRVESGVVHLMGNIRNKNMKNIAQKLVQEVAGVKQVKNELMIIRHHQSLKNSDLIIGKDLGIT